MAVAGIIDGTAAEFGYKVLAANILPDHVHLLIADMGNSVAEIMKIIKGRSARAINAARGVSSAGSGRRGHVWAEAYSDTEVRSEEQLANTIKYISDQYVKHAGRWGVLSATPDLSRGLQKGERQIDWKEYEYRTHERVI